MNYLAYCGLLCDECPLYIATKNNDLQAKEKTVDNCGVCSMYPCETIEKRLPIGSESRSRLDTLSQNRR